jgi:Kef-type K+ transport system membrane component KefB
MSLGSADLAQLLLALALLVIAAHGGGHVFAKLHQPRVIGEIIGGLLLGPTLFGVLAPDLQARVFPDTGPTAAFLGATYQLGLLLLMFCSGAEMRAVFRRGEERAVSLITITGMVVPFLVGLLLVRVVDNGPLMGTAHSRPALVLVFALAIAVTSIPVISRIMFDLGILHTSFARIVLGVAVIEDVVVYIVLAIALGFAAGSQGGDNFGVPALLNLHSGTASFMAFHVVVTLAFFVFMLTAGAWLFRRTLRLRVNILKRSSPIAYQLLFVFLATLVCVLLGITALFGAFLAGIVSSTASGTAAAEARGAVKDFAFAFFVPIYFAIVGLQLDLVHHFDPLFFVWFLLFACVAKTVSVFAGARLGGERRRSAVNLAVAMNARGGPGIVLASVTYTAGVISQSFYAALIMLVIVTSLAAGSWLGHVVRSGQPLRDGEEEPTSESAIAVQPPAQVAAE